MVKTKHVDSVGFILKKAQQVFGFWFSWKKETLIFKNMAKEAKNIIRSAFWQ